MSHLVHYKTFPQQYIFTSSFKMIPFNGYSFLLLKCFRRKKSTYARMISIDPGAIMIIGSFKKQNVDPDFKVRLLFIAFHRSIEIKSINSHHFFWFFVSFDEFFLLAFAMEFVAIFNVERKYSWLQHGLLSHWDARKRLQKNQYVSTNPLCSD